MIGAVGIFTSCASSNGKKPKRGKMNPAEAFKKRDANQDGFISYHEFQLPPKRGGKQNGSMNMEDKKQEVFNLIDANNDGQLSPQELSSHRAQRPPRGERLKPE